MSERLGKALVWEKRGAMCPSLVVVPVGWRSKGGVIPAILVRAAPGLLDKGWPGRLIPPPFFD